MSTIKLGMDLLQIARDAFDNPQTNTGNVIRLGRPVTPLDRDMLQWMQDIFRPLPYPVKRQRRHPIKRISRVGNRPPRGLAF